MNLPPAHLPDGRTHRIVVTGLGSIGRRHTRLLRARGDVVVEVCEPSPEALERARPEIEGLRVYRDFSAALASQPDSMVIATPHSLHARQAIAGMNAGVHILCEKPLCTEVAEAAEIMACARSTGKVLVVGFQLHFQPGVLRMRELIRQGVLGEVVHVHVRVGSFITLRNSISRYQESLPGALLLDYAHQPDLLIWLLDELPTGITCTGLQAGALPFTSDPNILALTLDYARPLLATVHLNYIQMPQRHEWEIVGDQGWIVMDPDRGILRLGRRETESEIVETFSIDRDADYRREHQAFFDCIAGIRPAESPADAAARSVELFALAMRSWREGRRVECGWRTF